MPDAAYVFLGVVFGVFAGVYLASRHSHRLKKLVEDEKRLSARAVRSATDQISTKLEQREHELAQFQNRMDDERRNAELGVSKLKADFARLQSQIGALKAEFQSTTEDAFRELAQFHDVATSLEGAIGSYTQLIETVESRLLATNDRLRKLGIASMDASARSSAEQEPEAARGQPVDGSRREFPRVKQ